MAPSSSSPSPSPSSRKGRNYNDNARDFPAFLEGWMVRQEQYLDELQSATRNCHESLPDDDLKELVTRVLSHYQQYYQCKSIAAGQNVFPVFAPYWFSSLEKSFLWIAGFKPSLAFKLLRNSVEDLSDDQWRKMTQLASKTRVEERFLNEAMAKIHERMAAPPLMEQVRISCRVLVDGERLDVDTAMELLRSSMESILSSADLLRMSTAKRVMDLLSPAQGVRFLAAAAQLHLHIRSCGLQRDAERGDESDAE